jgi:MoaA/NifB/PqqE/SkfB family radical SAM enzyme
MQSPQLKLKEIIWEITRECNNHCSYCGSSEGWGERVNLEDVISIADAICRFPPKEISISGGDPTLVPLITHERIVKQFLDAKICAKIIVNPKSFRKNADFEKIIGLYDWIGLSINDTHDVARANEIWRGHDSGDCLPKNLTVITNFNTINVFDYDVIKTFVGKRCWQIQYTIDDKIGLYNSAGAISYLQDRLNKSGNNIVIADNMNGGPCGAGMCSLGILATGEVIGCLSMRSWDNCFKVEGNVLKRSLEEIWIYEFQKYRFGEFKCCKDVCGRCLITKEEKKSVDPLNPDVWITTDRYDGNFPRETIIMYGTVVEPTTVYGVFPGQTMMYAVATPEPKFVYGCARINK